MAREKKSTNFFEILKRTEAQKPVTETPEGHGTGEPSPAPVAPPVKSMAPMVHPVKPVVLPPPLPRVQEPPPEKLRPVPVPPVAVTAIIPTAPIPVEPTLRMSYTTVLFLFLIFSAVPFVTYSLGREVQAPSSTRQRTTPSVPERAAPRQPEKSSTPAVSPSTARMNYTLRLFRWRAVTAEELSAARANAIRLDQELLRNGLKGIAQSQKGGNLDIVYGTYPDNSGTPIRSDIEKLRRVTFKGSVLNPITQEIEH